MTARSQRSEPSENFVEGGVRSDVAYEPMPDVGFDPSGWQAADAREEFSSAGGRAVLAWALGALCVAWIAFAAWSAGQALAGGPIAAPELALWVAIAAGPLAFLGLVWLMFGRTRRKEAEQFTRSVIAMRNETESLQALLGVLMQRIEECRSQLGSAANGLMQLGDEATGRLGGITRDLDRSTADLSRHGELLDRAAEMARNDIAVLLTDLPQAEESARQVAEQLRLAGNVASRETASLAEKLADIQAVSRDAELQVSTAAANLSGQLREIEAAGASASERVDTARGQFTGAMDAILDRASVALDHIRSGVDSQANAVAALVEQSRASIGTAGAEAADALASSVTGTRSAIEALSARIAEQERISHRTASEIARALSDLDAHFGRVADQGGLRAAAFVSAIERARMELEDLSQASGNQGATLDGLVERTSALNSAVTTLTGEIRDQLAPSIAETEAGTNRLLAAAHSTRPEIDWMREAASEASARLHESGAGIAEQQDRFATFLAVLDDGVAGAESRIDTLTASLTEVQEEAVRLSRETGPALIEAMVQVRETAAQAAARAREAIESIIPESAEKLSQEARQALELVIRATIEDKLRDVETTAARAVDAARTASDRLSQQMLNLGQSATALEQHIEETSAAQRDRDSEAFARRVSLLIDSMHSASIDVGKILSDEIDEKAWDAYLKGDRGVFTRRAVRLVDGTESRAILAHYDAEPEFQHSANRYIHDFEAMLRRVVAERDGGPLAVTLMSSDMGKLYAALAQALERRR